MTYDLIFDARHVRASGIGIYSRCQIDLLREKVRRRGWVVGLLGYEEQLTWAADDFDILRVPPAPMYGLREQLTLGRAVGALKPKAFWTPHYPFPLLSNVKTFVTIHDVLHALDRQQGMRGFGKKVYARWMLRQSLNRSAKVFVPSRSTEREVERLFGNQQNVVVAPCGIDSSWFEVDGPIDLGPVRLPENFLLYVGNVKEHKNLRGLLEAFEVVRNEFDFDLVLAGGAADVRHEDAQVFERIQNLGPRVHLIGNLSFPDLRGVVRRATALIIPSFYEGVGLPPLEAMASGTPVLASDIPSLRETCEDAASYFDPSSVDSMVQSIVSLFERPDFAADLSLRGLVRVRERQSSIDHRCAIDAIGQSLGLR
ncbi:glycosyltransferase family 4 protein [Arthrobacter sp. H14-L1]|uniref:glycosyltransferase family 4 protein n=1 Tax=Arthrobacter sp. H14-L1 TaxID=2996697 RepID=UPI00226E0ED6|nr:glycosyltransferase family 1 protein [Arthrobacter sp. H14-L1]MCY0905458.1 glycosyltransferase family 1 protein [Arthrobacter sp. H14-L1]